MNPAVVTVVMIAGIVVVIGLFVMTMDLGGGTADAADRNEVRTPDSGSSGSSAAGSSAAGSSLAGGTARPGKTPDRPAPEIPDDLFARLDEHYEVARKEWNAAQKARQVADHDAFAEHCHAGFEAMNELYDLIDPYTTWYEEADFGGWAMPAEYEAMIRRVGPYDKLHQRIKKNMPMRPKRR